MEETHPIQMESASLDDLFRCISQLPSGSRTGVVGVRSTQFQGIVSVQEGRIVGVADAVTAEKGKVSLQKLLASGRASMIFKPTHDPLALSNDGLFFDVLSHFAGSSPVPEAAPHDPIRNIGDRSVPQHYGELLRAYKTLATTEDRNEFFKKNPLFERFADPPSLNDKQRELLQEVTKLSGFGLFLIQTREFAEAMQEGMTDAQKALVNQRIYDTLSEAEKRIFLQRNPRFAQQQQQRQWGAEVARLQAHYESLDSEQSRNEFLKHNQKFAQLVQRQDALAQQQQAELNQARKQSVASDFNKHNPMFSEQVVVLRGEDAVSKAPETMEKAGPAPVDTKANQLQAVDYVDDRHFAAKPEDDRKILQTQHEKRLPVPPRKRIKFVLDHLNWAFAALIVLGVIVGGNMYLRHLETLDENLEPTSDIEVFNRIVKSSIKAEIPSVHVDILRSINAGQTAQAYGGESSAAAQQMAAKVDSINRLIKESKYLQASALCREILELNPQETEVRTTLIRALMALGKWHEAREACIAGIKVSKSREDILQFQELLKEIRWNR